MPTRSRCCDHAGQGDGAMMEHMGTGDYAYGIAGIREWPFAQQKSS